MKERQYTDYQNFKAPDFAMDDSFIDWIKSPDSQHSEFWEDWCEQHPDKIDELNNARILVLSFQFNQKNVSNEEIDFHWEQLKKGKQSTQKTYKKWNGNSGKSFFVRIAAILVVSVAFTYALYFMNSNPNHPIVYSQTVKKETQAGQKLSFYLPDGSFVKLNSESSIEYPSEFTGSLREVKLAGEAFFEVIKDPQKPFRVETEDIITEVLGTSFNVNTYPESSKIQVALVEGKVKVIPAHTNNDHKAIILLPGETLSYSKLDGNFNFENIDQAELLCWKDGELNFDRISFMETINEMERWYGIKFSIDEKASIDPAWRFHGKFKNKDIAYILRVISYPDLFEYRIQKDTVFIF